MHILRILTRNPTYWNRQGIAQHRLEKLVEELWPSAHGLLMLRLWGLAFLWTQLIECPVYIVLLRWLWPGAPAGASRVLLDLAVGFGASLLSHPPATACFWSFAGVPHSFVAIECGVVLVETAWVFWAQSGGLGRALCCAAAANLASIAVGEVLHKHAPHLLGG